jgi:hypothetical protein
MSLSLNVKDYCKIYDNFYSKEFCNSIVESLKDVEYRSHSYYTASGTYVTTDTDLSVTHGPIPQSAQMHEALWGLLHHYVYTDLNLPCFKSWHGLSTIRFNKYDKNTKMEWHCDHIHDLFDGERKGVPILSIVAALNDDYEGGEFVMWDNEKIELSAGSVMIFPSNFMYPHAVMPVISGTRHSFVSWVW